MVCLVYFNIGVRFHSDMYQDLGGISLYRQKRVSNSLVLIVRADFTFCGNVLEERNRKFNNELKN